MRHYGLAIATGITLIATGEVQGGPVDEKLRRVLKALRGGIDQVRVAPNL